MKNAIHSHTHFQDNTVISFFLFTAKRFSTHTLTKHDSNRFTQLVVFIFLYYFLVKTFVFIFSVFFFVFSKSFTMLRQASAIMGARRTFYWWSHTKERIHVFVHTNIHISFCTSHNLSPPKHNRFLISMVYYNLHNMHVLWCQWRRTKMSFACFTLPTVHTFSPHSLFSLFPYTPKILHIFQTHFLKSILNRFQKELRGRQRWRSLSWYGYRDTQRQCLRGEPSRSGQRNIWHRFDNQRKLDQSVHQMSRPSRIVLSAKGDLLGTRRLRMD